MNMSTGNCEESASVHLSFYDYTKEWMKKVNRGGLFETNDQSFRLFKAIEIALQLKLPSALLTLASEVWVEGYSSRSVCLCVCVSPPLLENGR